MGIMRKYCVFYEYITRKTAKIVMQYNFKNMPFNIQFMHQKVGFYAERRGGAIAPQDVLRT